jgi:hypothetical protein
MLLRSRAWLRDDVENLQIPPSLSRFVVGKRGVHRSSHRGACRILKDEIPPSRLPLRAGRRKSTRKPPPPGWMETEDPDLSTESFAGFRYSDKIHSRPKIAQKY